MPSGMHGVRCMGMPPTRLKAFWTTVWKMLARQTRGTFSRLPTGHARVRPNTHVQSRAHRSVGRGSVGRAAGRRRSTQGMEATAATGGPEAFLEQGQWPDGCHHHVLEAAGLDMASPHDLRHCKWARSGLARDLPWRGWANTDERKELLSCPLLEPLILANKRAQRRPQEAPAIKAALGVIQAGWWTQEVANKKEIDEHPFCLNCGPLVLGSAQHRLWACPAYRETRMDVPPTHQHQGQTATGDKLKWERGLMPDC